MDCTEALHSAAIREALGPSQKLLSTVRVLIVEL